MGILSQNPFHFIDFFLDFKPRFQLEEPCDYLCHCIKKKDGNIK